MIDTSEDFEQLMERTEATLEKFRERADSLQEELGAVSAATKVQVKAMIARLERKYERGKARLSTLQQGGEEHADELNRFHHEVINSLSDMKRTIDRILS
ncbi:MAG: hypothetical protein ACE5HP_11085 [Gemmatimonadota bacterium]